MPFTASELAGRGFLPVELPPPFSSASLGAACTSIMSQLGNLLIDAGRSSSVRPAIFNLARQGTLRRRLSIPHPLHYINLCSLIESNSLLIDDAVSRSTISSSQPKANTSSLGRAIDRRLKDEALTDESARVRATARYVVHADITNCYGSIYTHTIGWALAGKKAAKAYSRHTLHTADPDYPKAVVSHQIDKAVSDSQDRQTLGIPIGPDASLVLAEALLSRADVEFVAKLPAGAVATRHVDDYQIGVRSWRDGEEVLAWLGYVLRDVAELELNSKKTRIVELPEAIDAPWVTQLKGILRDGAALSEKQQRRDILRLVDTAFAERNANPDAHVLAYALSILRSISASLKNWSLAQNLLFQVANAEPGVLPRVLLELKWYRDRRAYIVDKDRLSELLALSIARHASQYHSSEVIWALWGYQEFQIPVPAQVADHILTMDDPLVSLVGLHLEATSQFIAPVNLANQIAPSIEESDFWGPRWPLAYEGIRSSWLPASAGVTAISQLRGFKLLSDAGVSFFDPTKTVDLAPKDLAVPGAPPYGGP